MSRLFWKFFFAFWLTLLVANLVLGAVIWLHKSAEAEHWDQRRHGQPPTFMLGVATTILQHEGEGALKQLLEDWQQSRPEPIFAADAAGRDLLGRPLPQEALQKARDGIRNGTTGPWQLVQRAAPASELLLFIPERPRHEHGLWPLDPGGLLHAGPPPGGPAEGMGRPGSAPPEPGKRPPPFPWLLIGAVLAASLAFSALLAWSIVGPIRRLRQGFREVAAGRLETRMGPGFNRRKDEIGELGQDFDAMTQQLEALIGTQRRLFHDVSHELRSPLARLQAAVGLLHQDPNRIGGGLKRIERETQRLDELVDELLTLARLESGTSGPLVDEIDVPALVHSIADDADFEARAQGREVNFDDACGTTPALVLGRAELLGRALENVIRNGIKYTAPGTAVLLSARREDDHRLHLQVCDAGPGVPEGELEAIFTPFHRGASDTPQRGYGLGLAIARRAIQAHGGSIQASNRPEGGFQVDIHLPLLAKGA